MKSVFSLTLLLFTLLALPYAVLAQSNSEDKGSLKSGTIDSQFDYIYSVSNNYQEYKVVKRTNLDQLKSNMLDSMRTMRQEVADLKGLIASQKDSIASLNNSLVTAETEKQEAIDQKDNFTFLGMGVHKAVYSSFMWILVAALAVALAFFSFQYFSSFKKINKARKDLAEVQEEFDNHRKNMLDRERKLKRELVDAQLGR
ncbi:hypothetical protein PBT90_19605 [Algoriphagus halophytocola]|uniref:tRNA (Guanine-N1)-methyltransferase n=1 Tax=Algoriphagus halophytocola TaxID=2991499 RepID=A0ABY6MDT9_9BACT|nr:MULTISPECIES: hypothetical protein [unclassified Algoriphagus]UZD21723.1 hypothetical protein OM944_13740 [Algoriphagus sp. TR-M5]WBL42935.1 hypothetical protein PBT90_19605 [Algoriphagus sp. TR-M9]